MARTRYLADTSVFGRLTKPPVAAAFAPLAAEGQVGICASVAFELGSTARNPSDYVAVTDLMSSFPAIATNDADHRRALEIQAALATRGQHRALSLVDALVAAIAEAHNLVILHYDADFELIAEVTGHKHAWIVARGSAE